MDWRPRSPHGNAVDTVKSGHPAVEAACSATVCHSHSSSFVSSKKSLLILCLLSLQLSASCDYWIYLGRAHPAPTVEVFNNRITYRSSVAPGESCCKLVVRLAFSFQININDEHPISIFQRGV